MDDLKIGFRRFSIDLTNVAEIGVEDEGEVVVTEGPAFIEVGIDWTD